MSGNLSYKLRLSDVEILPNYVNMTFNNSVQSEYIQGLTDRQHFAIGVYLVIIGALACCGNALVLVAVWKYKSLRTTTNIFITNLALADLCISVFGFPFSAISNFALSWIYGYVACRWYAFNGMVFGFGSIGFLAAISVDRYFMTCRHRSFLELKRCHYLWASLAIWMNSAVWASGPLFGWGCYDLDPSGAACGLTWECSWILHATYTVTIFIVCFTVPCIIIVYCYTKTYKFLSFLGSGGRHDSIEWVHQKEVTRMCLAAIVLFFLAWAPYAVVFLWATFGNPSSIPIMIAATPALFAKSSAFYNPLIYALMNTRFRLSMKRLFKCENKSSEEEQMELNIINARI